MEKSINRVNFISNGGPVDKHLKLFLLTKTKENNMLPAFPLILFSIPFV
jgi:hypothetical protein